MEGFIPKKTMQPITDIPDYLPHRPPFIMVGELLFADEQHTRSAFTVPAEGPLVDADGFTEAGLLENMAQTVAAGAGYRAKQTNQPVEAGYIAAVKNLEISHLPKLHQRIITETVLKESIGNMIVVAATVTLDDTFIARCEMNMFVGSQS